MTGGLSIVILGLSITSSWGNGHAVTYRALVKALTRRGHDVLFLERDRPWYAVNRDQPTPSGCRTVLYDTLEELADRHAAEVRAADLVIIGSFVPDGVAVARWVVATARGLTAFYDIDTPATLARLAQGDQEYLSADLVPAFDLYLSFTGGPTLRRLEREFGARRARVLYCSADPDLYHPETMPLRWDLGYLGTYSADRQPGLDRLLLESARRWLDGRFAVAGAQYPAETRWPAGVEHVAHLPPAEHRAFYNAQRFTLNVTRADMVAAGWSPSVRLFEAAACATPIVSDPWTGLDRLFVPGREILIARGTGAVLAVLRNMPEERRLALGQAARSRLLAEHTPDHRVEALESYLDETVARDVRRAAVLRG
ncbi:MAG TPA: glycosyltransferase [Azospirillaceae bacterium]|nr:glycosyltransferase [Azospirillaceae bacterium]